MLKLWGIRHIRWLYMSYQVHKWARECSMLGLGLGYPNDSDLRVLDAVWRGER